MPQRRKTTRSRPRKTQARTKAVAVTEIKILKIKTNQCLKLRHLPKNVTMTMAATTAEETFVGGASVVVVKASGQVSPGPKLNSGLHGQGLPGGTQAVSLPFHCVAQLHLAVMQVTQSA